jgi:aspartyl/asparaginyl beta-hydroxylase (cupin superfamily)
MLTDAELWQLTSDNTRIRADASDAAEREAEEEPSAEAQERWLKAKAEYERLAR